MPERLFVSYEDKDTIQGMSQGDVDMPQHGKLSYDTS